LSGFDASDVKDALSRLAAWIDSPPPKIGG
jgi:hypothetical protein